MNPTATAVLGFMLGAVAANNDRLMTPRAIELERRKRELAAWNAEAMTRRRYSPELAAAYRELRLERKRRSRALGHGTG